EPDATPAANNFRTIHDVPHEYHVADTDEKIMGLIAVLNIEPEFCFDTETTSLCAMDAELVGFSFSVKAGHAWYVPFPADQAQAAARVEMFRGVFEDESKTLIGQNIKYDYQVLKNYGLTIRNRLFDTMVAHFLIMPDMRHNMDVL